jgi:hypothetical protein
MNQTGVACTITKLDGSASPSKKWAADDPIEALPGERTPNGTGLAGQHWDSSSPVERLHGLFYFKPQCGGIPTVKGVLCNWQVLANQHDGADEADSTLVLKDYKKRPPYYSPFVTPSVSPPPSVPFGRVLVLWGEV